MSDSDLKLVYDMSDEDYFGAAAASNSLLGELKKSPAHLRESIRSPAPATPAMRFGSAFHVATLEPTKFAEQWARGSELRGNTKEGKAAKAELEEQYDSDKILKPADYDAVCQMRDNVLTHSIAGELLEGASKEVAAFWTDPATQIHCKAKIDVLPGDEGRLIDLKSTVDASPAAFAKAIGNFSYHRQAAHYLNPFDTRDEFLIVACEKKPPYAVAVYRVADEAIEAGKREVAMLLERWAEVIDEVGLDGDWPGYDEVIYELYLPLWAQ